MALTYPDLLPGIFAAGASNHDEIPDTNADDGRMAWDVGFPSETSQPIVAGGVPPRRLDMNGLGNRLSQHIFFQQSGSLYVWSADLDYPAGAHILGSNGVEYIAVAASGPSETGGAVNPVNDVNLTRWKSYQRSLVDIIYPVGSIYMSANNVNPGTLFGGTWQAITGRFILAAGGNYPLGTTGGAATKVLTVDNMPSHTHAGTANNYSHTHNTTTVAKSITVNTASAGAHTHGVTSPSKSITTTTAGSHTHTRGSMNITGTWDADDLSNDTTKPTATGAFGYAKSSTRRDAENGSNHGYYITFDASKSWSGSTSSNGGHSHSITIAATSMTTGSAGAHTHSVTVSVPGQTAASTSDTHNHTLTIGSTGGGAAFNIMPPYVAVNVWKRTA